MSTMSNVNNVKFSTMSNCQQCQVVKLSAMPNCKIVNNVKLSNFQIVKLSQYQMSCIIRVCRLTQRIDCVLFFRIFVCDGDSVRLNSSYFHSKYNYAVDGTTHSRTEKKNQNFGYFQTSRKSIWHFIQNLVCQTLPNSCHNCLR